MPANSGVNMSVSPVRKCLVASALARSSRNCSIDSRRRVITTLSSRMVKSAIRIVIATSASVVSGTGGRRSGEPKRSV